MSTNDFHDRLQRINTTSQQQTIMRDTTRSAREPQMKFRRYGQWAFVVLIVGIIGIFIGQKVENGPLFVVSAWLGNIGVFALIGVLFLKLSAKRKPRRKASTKAQVWLSLLGFVSGVISYIYIWLAAAARLIETEPARMFSEGGFIIAFLLAFVSIIFGFMVLIIRGYGLGRVPAYFLFGFILASATALYFDFPILEWEQFTSRLQ